MKDNSTGTGYGHPIHSLMIAIPLGVFVMAWLGDIATASTHDPFWFEWSYRCIAIGIFFAIIAAIPGLMVYFSLKMRDFGSELATTQMFLIVAAALMYLTDLYLREGMAPFNTGRLAQVMTLEVVGLATMGLATWLGNQDEAIRKIHLNDRSFAMERRRTARQLPHDGFAGH